MSVESALAMLKEVPQPEPQPEPPTEPPPPTEQEHEALAEAQEERAAIAEFDGNLPRAEAEEVAKKSRAFSVLVRMPEGDPRPPRWITMIGDIKDPLKTAELKFGSGRVLDAVAIGEEAP